jgi:penicillin-binding protein 2
VLAILKQILGLTPEDLARIDIDLKRAAGFPAGAGAGESRLGAVRRGQRAPSRVGRRRSHPRLCPQLSVGRGGRPPDRLCRHASSEQYKKEKDPLLVTPGFKLGKDGIEKMLEDQLRGVPGAKRVEVTAHGKLVRELANAPDEPGKTVKLTIDAGLQEYVARRLGTNSGSAVVIDTHNGDVLAMVLDAGLRSQQLLRRHQPERMEDAVRERSRPLMNKLLQGLYPPGSTVKPMNGLALMQAGRRSQGGGALRRRDAARQPRLPLLEARRPWRSRSAPRHRPELRHLFLRDGPPGGL